MGRTNIIISNIYFWSFFLLAVGNNNNEVSFKLQIDDLKQLKKVDLVFLIDGSSSVGVQNFESELNFVKKLLSDFEVKENGTKVSIVVFGSNAVVYEHSDKCELLNSVLPTINYPGSNTNTLGALLAARELLQGRKNVHKVIFLVTDGFSNGGDPVPVAEDLKNSYHNITIFGLGIQNGNRKELEHISTPQNTYLLESFDQFDLLARKALHSDLKEGDYIRLEEQKCGGCDPLATCTCGTTSGHYSCKCRPGYFGSGKPGDCTPCPRGTYHQSDICLPCPDYNHVTNESNPATSVEGCICKVGYKRTKDFRCEVMRCPKLKPPQNGYFVGKTNCPNVLNSACGVRCNVGYSLRGTSIRICRENGQWDGLEVQCHLKTCPRPPIPVGGEVFCNNTDLDVSFQTLPDELPLDTECLFNCQPGSNLIGSTKRTCLPIEQWDGLKTTCKPIRCIKVPKIPFGKISPPECSREKQKHGARCKITCAEGFSGAEIECVSKGRHGAWSSKPRCTDVTPPVINCPKPIETVAQLGENFALVHWEEPEIHDNSHSHINIWWEPRLEEEEDDFGPYKFEIGTTTVTYHAVDQSGNGAKCNFTVTVLDLEPPKFLECTNPPPYLIGKEGIDIEWEEPIAVDNSGDLTIQKSHNFGPLPIGTTEVEYIAWDMSNNSASCLINITVTQTSCENEVPKGLEHCNNLPNGILCVLTCEEGYAFSMTDKATCDHQEASWVVPECTPTEIPKEVSGETEDCLELKKKCLGGECELLECGEDNRIKREATKNNSQDILDLRKDLPSFRNEWKEQSDFLKEEENNQMAKENETDEEEALEKNLNNALSSRSYWNDISTLRNKRQAQKASKFRLKINKNIHLEKIKGVVPETLTPTCKNGSVPLKSRRYRCVKCPRGFFFQK